MVKNGPRCLAKYNTKTTTRPLIVHQTIQKKRPPTLKRSRTPRRTHQPQKYPSDKSSYTMISFPFIEILCLSHIQYEPRRVDSSLQLLCLTYPNTESIPIPPKLNRIIYFMCYNKKMLSPHVFRVCVAFAGPSCSKT